MVVQQLNTFSVVCTNLHTCPNAAYWVWGGNNESAEQHKLMDSVSQGMTVSRMFEEGLLSLFYNHFLFSVCD